MNHINYYLFKICTVFLLCTAIKASGKTSTNNSVSIKIEADKIDKLEVGEELFFDVKIVGSNQKPNFPKNQNEKIINRGTYHKTNIINGVVNSFSVFKYSYSTEETGKYAIGPVWIDENGEKILSNKITFEVLKDIIKKEKKDDIENKKYFIKATVDNKTPYINQQINYAIKLYSRKISINKAELQHPIFEGFWEEELEPSKSTKEYVNNKLWSVSKFEIALFPAKTGNLVIPKSKIKLNIPHKPNNLHNSWFSNPFFAQSSKNILLKSDKKQIKVKSLPTRKSGEYINLVGNFSIKAKVKSSNINVGESTTLTVISEGIGNIWDFDLDLPSNDFFNTYKDDPKLEKKIIDRKIGGTKIFKFAIVATKGGEVSLPEIAINFFNPITNKYTAKTSDEIILSIKGTSLNSLNRETKDLAKHKVKIDLMPIKDHNHKIKSEKLSLNELISGLILLIILLFISFLIFGFQNYKNKLLTRRNKYTFKKFQEDLKAPNIGKANEIYNILLKYIGYRLNIQVKESTVDELMLKISAKSLAQDTKKEIKEALFSLEKIQYSKENNLINPEDLKISLLKVAAKIESEVKSYVK